MDFQEVVRRRRMVRRYTADPVDPAAVHRMIENATRAPNAGFTQGWDFLVLDSAEDVARFWSAATPPDRAGSPDRWLRGMRTAPVVIVPLASEAAYRRRYAEPDKSGAARRSGGRAGGRAPAGAPVDGLPWSVPYWFVDTGMAVLLILQTAVDEGLGACLLGIPAQRVDELRTAFGVPEGHEPVGAITVGHPHPDSTPGGSPSRRSRRPTADVLHRGRW
ncbi:nitroreductase family protein [Georgenia alba]|uniref:Nitroreductase family protein n=1 Tax=Georgenia alba TaxID=2233858 RepID=A0ABW2Q7G3_9MICO